MAKIYTPSIPYPDFQVGTVIESEQVDANNRAIVSKITEVINFINQFQGEDTSGLYGAIITKVKAITGLTANNVQEALEQLKAISDVYGVRLDTIEVLNVKQDTRLTALETRATANEAKDTSQDTRLASLETRATANETKDTSQDTRLTSLETRASANDTLNTTQNNKIASLETFATTSGDKITSLETRATANEAKDTTQDGRLVVLEQDNVTNKQNIAKLGVSDNLIEASVQNVDKKVDEVNTQIKSINNMIDQIGETNVSVELIQARTSRMNGEFNTLKERLDATEIAVVEGDESSPEAYLNFVVNNTSEENIEWTGKVALGDLSKHSNDEYAHSMAFAKHELDEHSHEDIRELCGDGISAHNTSVVAHQDIREMCSENVSTHNTDVTAHEDIREAIASFPTSLPANGGNAQTVNGKTVLSNVPANAVFTDTVYTHPGSGTNPHGTTKSDVGLGSVLNYGIATTAEAQAGTSNVKYMTPALVAEACKKFGGDIVGKIYNHEEITAYAPSGSTSVIVKSYSNNSGGMIRLMGKSGVTGNTTPYTLKIIIDGVVKYNDSIMGFFYTGLMNNQGAIVAFPKDLPFSNSILIEVIYDSTTTVDSSTKWAIDYYTNA